MEMTVSSALFTEHRIVSCGNVLLFKAGGSPGDCEPCEDTWLCAQVTFGWVRSSSHLFQGQWPRAQASEKGGCHGLVFWLLVCCMMKWHRLRGHRASGADLPVLPLQVVITAFLRLSAAAPPLPSPLPPPPWSPWTPRDLGARPPPACSLATS